MQITEKLLETMKAKPDFYSDGVILPDGEYILCQEGHLKTLMSLLPYTENEIWKMIPENDSALFWLIEKTSCVITDYNSSVGVKMTPIQEEVFHKLVEHNIIAPEFFDISKRKK